MSNIERILFDDYIYPYINVVYRGDTRSQLLNKYSYGLRMFFDKSLPRHDDEELMKLYDDNCLQDISSKILEYVITISEYNIRYRIHYHTIYVNNHTPVIKFEHELTIY